MGRLQEHLDRLGGIDVALLVTITCGVFFSFLLFAMSQRNRMFFLLVLLTFCQGADKFEALGVVPTLCKFAVAPLAVFVAAVSLVESRGQLRLSFYLAMWVACAIWGVTCVVRTPDAGVTLPIATSWLLIVFSGATLSYRLTSQERLDSTLVAICIGSGMASLFALLGSGDESNKEFFGRFAPFGANPNQAGMLFLLVVVLGYYLAVNAKSIASRMAFGILAGVSTGELILTLSRAAIGIGLVAVSPLLVRLSRYPLRLVLLGILSVPVIYVVIRRSENASSDHLYGSVDRSHHWELGLREIEKRPLVGLFGTNVYPAIDKGWNSHNAFIQLMYTGGVVLAFPMSLLYLQGLYSGVRVWLLRDSGFSRGTMGYLVLLQALLIAHGLVNDALFYPTYATSFLVVVLCFFFHRVHLIQPNWRLR